MTTTSDLTWQSATTLAELGELTARWLEGSIPETPSYLGAPDDETSPLIPILAAANRAGYVTTSSQPGHPAQPGYDGAHWSQRAAVEGIADRETAVRLVWEATLAGLWAFAAPVRAEHELRQEVTLRAGAPYTFVGTRAWPELAWEFDAEDTELEAAIGEAFQVTIVDFDYRETDLVWQTLATALNLAVAS